MNEADILKEFKDAEAILEGHFILSSGLHSNRYMQCARVLMDAKRAEKLCKALADKVRQTLGKETIDMVVSPAMGGVVVGYEMGRQLGVPAVFCERVDGKFSLRRGFDFPINAKILVVEDVVTTGKSSLECFDCIREYGGNIIAEACLVDRSNGEAAGTLAVPLVSLMTFKAETFQPDAIPTQLQQIPAVKPGSRFIKAG